MPDTVLAIPKKLRRGHKRDDQEAHLASAVELINLMCRNFELDSLADTELLDMGCGTKLVQAFLYYDLPIKRYIGVDVFREMIEFLASEVTDERFSFAHMNTHNDMYNPKGEPLDPEKGLPIEAQHFDLICLFSVFTHLAPHDYTAMLKLLRPYIKPEGKIIFSLYVNEETEGGMGRMDAIAKALGGNSEPSPKQGASLVKPQKPDFIDQKPSRPLTFAMYSWEHALALVEGTGWEVEALNDPESSIQHYMICRPV